MAEGRREINFSHLLYISNKDSAILVHASPTILPCACKVHLLSIAGTSLFLEIASSCLRAHREVIRITLDKYHSLTPGERTPDRRRPMAFVEGLEELVGSGAVPITKSVAREMLWKMEITECAWNVGEAAKGAHRRAKII